MARGVLPPCCLPGCCSWSCPSLLPRCVGLLFGAASLECRASASRRSARASRAQRDRWHAAGSDSGQTRSVRQGEINGGDPPPVLFRRWGVGRICPLPVPAGASRCRPARAAGRRPARAAQKSRLSAGVDRTRTPLRAAVEPASRFCPTCRACGSARAGMPAALPPSAGTPEPAPSPLPLTLLPCSRVPKPHARGPLAQHDPQRTSAFALWQAAQPHRVSRGRSGRALRGAARRWAVVIEAHVPAPS